MPNWKSILRKTEHRRWPKPKRPWVMTMSWVNLLAAHWPIEPRQLRRLVPDRLAVDTWEGKAWISILPFAMDNTSLRGFTWSPRQMYFPEVNVRTYVTTEEGGPGVWFLSLDAASRLAVWGARTFFYLPYLNAELDMSVAGDVVNFRSIRTHSGEPQAEFVATYSPTGPAEVAEEGSFQEWIMERYLYYVAGGDSILRGDVHHEPWILQPGSIDIETNTLFDALLIELPAEPTFVYYADSVDSLGWACYPVDFQ